MRSLLLHLALVRVDAIVTRYLRPDIKEGQGDFIWLMVLEDLAPG